MKINGIPLFPLEKVHTRLRGYFVDQHRNIWSTRGPKATPRMLKGFATGNHHYFTLNGMSYSKTNLLDRVRFGTSDGRSFLEEGCHQAVSSPKPVEVAKAASQQVSVTDQRSHAATLDQGLKEKGWVIGNIIAYEDGTAFQIALSERPKVHLTQESVRAELQRLAAASPGTKFVSLKIDATVVATGFQWD